MPLSERLSKRGWLEAPPRWRWNEEVREEVMQAYFEMPPEAREFYHIQKLLAIVTANAAVAYQIRGGIGGVIINAGVLFGLILAEFIW